MRKILAISIVLVAGTALYSLIRFGFTFAGFLRGDGGAILEAATALIGIWALVIGFSFAAIGATFELSKLPASWKISIFRRTIIRKLTPFFILALLAGIIPFLSILHTHASVGVFVSEVTPWVIVGFALQVLLILSGALAAKSTYQALTLVPAIKSTLLNINHQKLMSLQEAHKEAFKRDHEEGNRYAMIPFSGFARGITGKAEAVHDELVIVFKTLFLEVDPQELDSGFRAISEWATKYPIKEIDPYLQSRLLPTCFHALRIDQATFNPQLFKSRLFYMSRLINILYESGAFLSASNSSNPVWDLIDDYSRIVGMSQALEFARMGVDQILAAEYKHSRGFGILINNLSSSILRLAREHHTNSLNVIEWLLEWYRRYLEAGVFRIWPNNRQSIEYLLQAISQMYSAIEEEYGNNTALWAGIHDLRYWILISLRRIQEAFVESRQPDSIPDDQRELAMQDFEAFNTAISKLIEIRKPEGDETAYENVRFPENPYGI